MFFYGLLSLSSGWDGCLIIKKKKQREAVDRSPWNDYFLAYNVRESQKRARIFDVSVRVCLKQYLLNFN